MVGPLAAGSAIGRQQRLDLSPGLISELVASDHPSSLAGSRLTGQTYQAAFVRHALVVPGPLSSAGPPLVEFGGISEPIGFCAKPGMA
jgi:hypothetical protein